MKYHSVGYYTKIIVIPAFLGLWMTHSGGNDYVKYFKNTGYIIGHSAGMCKQEMYDYEKDNSYGYLNFEKYDHDMFLNFVILIFKKRSILMVLYLVFIQF